MEEVGRRTVFKEVRRGGCLSWSDGDELALGTVSGISVLDLWPLRVGAGGKMLEEAEGGAVGHRLVKSWEGWIGGGPRSIAWGKLCEQKVLAAVDGVDGAKLFMEDERGEWMECALTLPDVGSFNHAIAISLMVSGGLLLAVGGKAGTIYGFWKPISMASPPKVLLGLTTACTTAIAFGPAQSGDDGVPVAIGTADGSIEIHKIHIATEKDNRMILTFSTDLFGPVSTVRWWSDPTCDKKASSVGFAAGNGIGLAELRNFGDPLHPGKNRHDENGLQEEEEKQAEQDEGADEMSSGYVLYTESNAHSRLVTDIAFSPVDGVLASTSFDGSVRLWQKSSSDKTLVSLSSVRSTNLDQPIFGICWSNHGVALAILESTPPRKKVGAHNAIATIAGEANDRAKFEAVKSRSAVVILAEPKRYTSEQVAKTLRACVQYVVGQPKEVAMGMWDVEKVVLSDVAPMDAKPMDAKLAGLRTVFDEFMRSQDMTRKQMRMGLYLSQSILKRRGGAEFERDYFRSQLHSLYCMQALKSFLDVMQQEKRREAMSRMEVETVEAMRQVLVGDVNKERIDEAIAVAGAVEAVLGERGLVPTGKFECPVCSAPVKKGATTCSRNDLDDTFMVEHPITWCLYTLLPISSGLPSRCRSCGVRASETPTTNSEYCWLPNRSWCYYCKLPMLRNGLDLISNAAG